MSCGQDEMFRAVDINRFRSGGPSPEQKYAGNVAPSDFLYHVIGKGLPASAFMRHRRAFFDGKEAVEEKDALLKAKDSDTIVTGRSVGAPVRVLKNRMSREYVRQEKAGADKMALERFTLGSLRKAVFDGDTENGSLMAGQAAGLLHEVRPVEEIFAAMVSEAKTCITGLYKETI